MDVISRGRCGQVIERNPILKHASEVYTRDLYLRFEKEYLDSLSVAILNNPAYYNSNDLEFVALSKESFGIKELRDRYTKSGGLGKCSRCMWEVEGMLWKHILRVIYVLNINRIPQHYILKWWSKSAKDRNVNQKEADFNTGHDLVNGMVFVKNLIRVVYDMAYAFKVDTTNKSLNTDGLFHR